LSMAVNEIEIALGYQAGFTMELVPKGARKLAAFNGRRKSWVLSQIYVPSAVVWISSLLVKLRACSRELSADEALSLCRSPHCRSSGRALLGAVNGIETSVGCEWEVGEAAVALPDLLMSYMSSKGADVRVGEGLIPNAWPRKSINGRLWKWKVILAYRWKKPDHINCQEMRAMLSTAKWRARRARNHGSRWLHLLDSQVCLGALSKGRSSSRSMASIVEAIAAVSLASSSLPVTAYIQTDSNPADKPSRYKKVLRKVKKSLKK